MMKGVWGKILRVDLTNGRCRFEKLSGEVYENFMGGAGLVAYTLWRECPQGTTAFEPANRIVFATGPFQGMKQTGAAKWAAGAISPSINMNADSAATASFGIEIKRAGIDAIVVEGCATAPSYVVIDDDKAEIKVAPDLWGKNAFETEDEIKARESDNFECVTIGQAGEKLLRFANIQTRKKSTLGRSGLGAVMGSKLLKGIAVRGTQSVTYHDPEILKKLNTEINRRLAKLDREKPFLMRCSTAGTARATVRFAPQGNLPIKNYRLANFPAGVEAFGTSNYVKKLNAKPWPCKYCVIQCHNLCEVKEGPYAYKGKGPEYESFAMMGLNTMMEDIEAVAYAGELANMYGMDTISLGGVIAWAMECYEKGVITKEDTDGLHLDWGNAKAMVELVRRIGEREKGLSFLLGEGTKIASQTIGKGSEQWAVQMKGQEIAAHNFRAQYISALNYCTGVAAGPNHERGNSQHIWVNKLRMPEWGIGEVDNDERWSWNNAPKRQAILHDYANVVNSACHCKFMEYNGYTMTDFLGTFNACTGLDWSHSDLQRCGERITNLQKLLNIRYGWEKKDDFNYPKRFMEPVADGPAAGKTPQGLENAILDYYRERGWDENGKPTIEKLKEIGLAYLLDS
jgi:aldehyde:ferredoxin oxidoreductase